jgi:hypothetical protein
MVFLMTGKPRVLKFRCPGCNLTVEGEAFPIQVWADAHVFDCFEERAKVHILDDAGRIREADA